ncbi:hypothetical protein GQ457_07G042580 [Hibiscus cannabinus]
MTLSQVNTWFVFSPNSLKNSCISIGDRVGINNFKLDITSLIIIVIIACLLACFCLVSTSISIPAAPWIFTVGATAHLYTDSVFKLQLELATASRLGYILILTQTDYYFTS